MTEAFLPVLFRIAKYLLAMQPLYTNSLFIVRVCKLASYICRASIILIAFVSVRAVNETTKGN